MSFYGKTDLEKYSVKGLNSAYYIKNFINEDQEEYLLNQIYKSPKPKWKHLKNRSLQNWGGIPHPKGMIPEKMPKWLEDYVNMVSELDLYKDTKHKPNHVLINEYKPGEGIMAHVDGPMYLPVIATISLGCHTLLDFYKKTEDGSYKRKDFSLLLERRSLLILKDSLYIDYLHSIEETTTDKIISKSVYNHNLLGGCLQRQLNEEDEILLPRKTTRVSLTIRKVSKTLKFKFTT